MSSNFILADLVATAAALAIFALVLVPPGYVTGWLLNLLGFRGLSLAGRLSLAVPVSISLCPIVTYLLWRFIPVGVGVFYGACLLASAVLIASERSLWAALIRSTGKYRLIYFFICAAWMLISVFALIDLQFGNRLYFPTVTYDYAFRSSVTAAIGRTGVPPGNPYFFPGQSFTLRYHYFWLLLCSVVQKIGGSSLSSRQAMIAGSVWCGVGLLAIIPLYLRFFQSKGKDDLRRRMLIGAFLLTVTGLDIFPVVLLESAFHSQMVTIEWWNDQVTAWVGAVLWVPHNIAALTACLMGFILLWNAARDPRPRSRIAPVVAAGVMFASSSGLAIYVAFAFAFFLAAWMSLAYITKRRIHTILALSSGLIALPLAVPFLMELFLHDSTSVSGSAAALPAAAPLQFAVRPFSFVDKILQIGSGFQADLIHLVLLPINYLFEFGFYFFAAAFMFRRLWRQRRSLTDDQVCLCVMALSSLLLCSFVRSSFIASNDLGWRGMLIAQFVLLLWGVELVSEFSTLTPAKRLLVVALLFAGVTGSIYEVFKIRFYPVISDATSTGLNRWLSQDRALGKRTYQLRGLYEELKRRTPVSAVFENNPNTNPQDLFHGMYADRQVAAETMSCAVTFGGTPSLCRDRISLIDDLFETPGAIAADRIDPVCDQLSIDVLIVKDTDRVWQNRESWVWRRTPMLANDYGRAYNCGSAAKAWMGVR